MLSRQSKRTLSVITAVAVISLFAIFPNNCGFGEDTSAAGLIRSAGNSGSDYERLLLLREAAGKPEIEPGMKRDLDSLIAYIELYTYIDRYDTLGAENVERWKGRAPLYDFFSVRRDTRPYIFTDISSDSPLYPIVRLYDAREYVWVCFEYGSVWHHEAIRDSFLTEARIRFEEVHAAFPENPIAQMYLGNHIAWPKYPAPDNAPKWAVYQREGLEKLADIIHWWIDNRMMENGEYGGGWGDDCEMWRSWVPVLVGFADPDVTKAQADFSRALLSQPHLEGGYMNRMMDVEHSAEDTGDTITPMMFLEPDNPEWSQRSRRILELFETTWSGVPEPGLRQFKSTFFTVDEVRTDPEQACDTPYHFRAMQPVMHWWQRTADPHATKIMLEWGESWRQAAKQAADGKPADIIPASIYWPGRSFARGEAPWWEPHNYHELKLYRWPSQVRSVCNFFLQAYAITGDESWLEPLFNLADIRKEYLENPPQSVPEEGTLAWCASKLGGVISGPLAKYRFLTGDGRYGSLLANDSSPYVSYRLGGSFDTVVKALEKNAETVSRNFPGWTSEVRYTDRTMVFPSRWFNTTGIDSTAHSIDWDLLYMSVTGDIGDISMFPMNAVRWLTPPRDIAVMVEKTGTSFGARLYHFGNSPRPMEAELYLLPEGAYEMTVTGKDGAVLGQSEVSVTGPRTAISFELPSRIECALEVVPSDG